MRLLPGDDQFCPCRADPLREFIEGPGPHTLEGLDAVLEACRKVPIVDPDDFLDDYSRAEVLMDEYEEAYRLWLQKTGQRLASGRKLAKLQSQNMRKYKELESKLRHEYIEQLHATTTV